MRIYIYAAILAALAGAGGWLYWQGRQAGELDQAKDTIKTIEDVNDAISANPDCSWRQRLLSQCE